MQAIQRRLDLLVMRGETLKEQSLRTITLESIGRLVKRRLNTWEFLGQETTKSQENLTSETQPSLMIGLAKIPSSASV